MAMNFLTKIDQPQRHEGTKLKKCYAFFLCGLEPFPQDPAGWLNPFRSEAEKIYFNTHKLSFTS